MRSHCSLILSHLFPTTLHILISMSVPHVAPSHDTYGQAKRRKVRKGTHSCWECKRRKMKCRFDPRIASTSCNGCRRRGSPCISQEFPEGLENVLMSIGTTSSDGTSFDGRTRPATPCERTERIPMLVSTIMEPSQYYKSPEVRLFQLFLPSQYSMIVTDGFPAISPDHQE
jgi:hypothetical protein